MWRWRNETLSARASGLAGLHPDCMPWLYEHGVAVLGCDGISDVDPSGIDGWHRPIHQIAIVAMGIHLIDNLALARLAVSCREREAGRSSSSWPRFTLSAGPHPP